MVPAIRGERSERRKNPGSHGRSTLCRAPSTVEFDLGRRDRSAHGRPDGARRRSPRAASSVSEPLSLNAMRHFRSCQQWTACQLQFSAGLAPSLCNERSGCQPFFLRARCGIADAAGESGCAAVRSSAVFCAGRLPPDEKDAGMRRRRGMIAEASNTTHAQAAQLEPSCSRITPVTQRWSPSRRGVTASPPVAALLCAFARAPPVYPCLACRLEPCAGACTVG